MLAAPSAHAETHVSFPFGGYYRAGKYTPVRITHDGPQADLTLHAGGAVETHIRVAQARTLVPWLVIDRLDKATLRIDGHDQPIDLIFRALTANQMLVGSTSNDMQVAQILFPGRDIVPVTLDSADLFPYLPESLTGLDAVILNEPSRDRLSSEELERLLAAGVAVVVPGEVPAVLKSWPWRSVGGMWLLQVELRGPQSLLSEAAYLPTFSWQPQWSPSLRWRMFWFGAIFALLLLMVALLRIRVAVWLGLALCIASAAMLMLWRQSLPPFHETGASIFVDASSGVQEDRWTYRTTGHDTSAGFPASDGSRPVFASESHFRESGIALECSDDGTPLWFTHRFNAGTRMAFLRRRVGQKTLLVVEQPITSPLLDLTRRSYLFPDAKIIGQTPGDWPDVIIEPQTNAD